MRIMSRVRDLEWGGVDRNFCMCAIVGVFTGKFIWSFVCRIYVVSWWAGGKRVG